MAYNKAAEERKWLRWKETEEKKLRELGVSEDTIQLLREEDWKTFNSDRRYYQRKVDTDSYLEYASTCIYDNRPLTPETLLNAIENADLFLFLKSESPLMIQIIIWKIEGLTSKEISAKCGLSESAINYRMWYLRKKLREIL